MNINIISGRLTGNPELKNTSTGKAVVNFTVAVDRGDKNKTTDFIDCVAWDSKAEFISKWFTKGSPIEIAGKTTTRTYEKDGHSVKRTELLVDAVSFVPRTNDSPSTSGRNTDHSDADNGGLEF